MSRSSAPKFRRRALLASAAMAAALPAHVFGRDAADDREVQAVQDRGKAARLRPFRVSKNEFYLGVGDAPDSFRAKAIALCLELAKDYLRHFEARGFAPERPAGRMTVVTLSGPGAFAAYLGEETPRAVGGVYDLETNRLIVFDNRADRGGDPRAERANTVALMHEATHQLTYNTGLLDRRSDVPLCLSEGLAMYGEVRRPKGPEKVGSLNDGWYPVLKPAGAPPPALIPLRELLTEDSLLNGEETAHAARAQSWLLIAYLMKTPARRVEFRTYLRRIRGRRGASRRIDDWTSAFGALETMDRERTAFLAALDRRRF